MGIYDREYYRREGPSFLESFATQGKVCKYLILLNIGVFVFQLITPNYRTTFGRTINPFTDALLLNTADVLHGQVWRLLTYAFLHDTHSIWHIVFNMLFLWWFGKDLEDMYGSREFLLFYLIAAVLGGIAFQASWLLGVTPDARDCLGASGAVMAVLVLCACHFPTRVIYIFMILPVPIWLFVLFYVASDLFGLLSSTSEGTAVTVHLGGAAFAFLYYKLNWRVANFWPDLKAWRRQRNRPGLRVYRGEDEQAPMPTPVAVAAPSSADIDEHLEAKLDAVLEKVARTGKDSLTDGEKQILMRASEVYKKRRS
ncbi:MAG: rhomboid family intramembrane serine protease [Gemmataceae bacterium]|nr:rhomboid family intramembrane serine protease [Gemmataceae bacterium]